MRRHHRSALAVEMLERRDAPAIDFTASTFGFGTLNLFTDGTATTVTLTVTAPNEITVDDGVTPTTFTGVNGKVVYNGSDAGDTVTFDLNGNTLAAGVWLGGGAGDDAITVTDSVTGGQLNSVLNVNAGEGTNTVTVTTFKSISSVNVTAGSGDDTLTVDDMNITGSFTANLGDGTNTVTVGGTTDVTVGGNVRVETGAGDDVISLGDAAKFSVGGSVFVVAGDGFNDVDLGLADGGVSTIAGSFTYAGGLGEDDLFIDQATIGGSVNIGAGDGVNVIDVASIGAVTIGGGFFFTGGFDDDNVTIGAGNNVSVGGSISLNLLDDLSGDGDDVSIGGAGEGGDSVVTVGGSVVATFGPALGLLDTFSMDNTKVRGSVSVNMGDGDNQFSLGTNQAVTIGGALLVRGGADVDDFSIGGVLGTKINGSVTVNAGNGDNVWNLGNDFFVRGNMTLTGGSGIDDVTLFATVSGGQVQGNLTVNLGQGDNIFAFQGSVGTATTGGQLTYNGGNGVDDVIIRGRVFRQLTARLQGGDDLFTYEAGAFVGNPFINRRGTAYVDGGLGNNLFTNTGPAFLANITRRVRMV